VAADMTEYKSVTPIYDLSWYVKWTASLIAIMGMILTAVPIVPLNLYFHLVGAFGWGVVGLLWHDRALIVINFVAAAIFAVGILKHYTDIL
jgi:uncharacterized membrane protein YjjB (DUF3815 family)